LPDSADGMAVMVEPAAQSGGRSATAIETRTPTVPSWVGTFPASLKRTGREAGEIIRTMEADDVRVAGAAPISAVNRASAQLASLLDTRKRKRRADT